MWKKFLQFSRSEVTTSACKWWFHLYGLCRDQCDLHNGVSLKSLCSCHVASVIIGSFESEDFISSLQKFVETATLGEFNARLEIITAFLQDMIQKGTRKCSNGVTCF